MIHVRLPDGSVREFEAGVSAGDVAAAIGPKLAKAALAAKVDGKVVDLSHKLDHDCDVAILTFSNPEGREVFRHSSTHLMAQAVKHLFPQAKLTVGPALEDGFYYDFDNPEPFTPEDLEKIEAEMAKIAAADLPIRRSELSRQEAAELFKSRGEPYKVETVSELPEGEPISIYEQGEFIDLCRGPHLPSTGRIKAFKLMSVAGAYWHGDEKNQQLQRLYGTSFEKKADLDEHLFRLEEAKRRDHRKLGPQLDLVSFHDESPAMPFWHPKGTVLWNTLEDWSREIQKKRGYQEVITPQVLKTGLWHQSGHYDHYKDNMYFMVKDEEEYGLKPMNCPCHCIVFGSNRRSYRELPLRLSEYGRLHRYERSGALHGLLRVRTLCQDDAHLFVREDQIGEEIAGVLELVDEIYSTFGMTYVIKFSTMPDDHMGDLEVWQKAEAQLEAALKQAGRPYELNPGDGAFYGPKLDFDVLDSLGRKWQLATIQLDFQMPRNFGLKYIDADGKEKQPVMIHRAIMGSLERFIGILIEHFAGAFPVWLSPVQVKVLPISDAQLDYAWQVAKELQAAGVRVEVEERNEKIGAKIRDAQLEKVPYMLVVGAKEADAGKVAVRSRELGDQGAVPVAEFKERVLADIRDRVLPPARS
ncbi:MAG: threonine--tRNA ligase [Symbiobacteriia bacterium]